MQERASDRDLAGIRPDLLWDAERRGGDVRDLEIIERKRVIGET